MFKILKIILVAGVFVFLNFFIYSKKSEDITSFEIVKLCQFPEELAESSGIIEFDSLIWSFNDSGGEPVIYAADQATGRIIKSVQIINAVNTDWEDIAQNDDFIMIGDFGNNEGSRKDLRIYCLQKKLLNKNDKLQKVSAGIIDFKYEDQYDFTPALYANPFDCEAMIATADSIYLFTKDWLNLETALYSMPFTEGQVTAKHIGGFNSDGLITGADLEKESGQIVLCGYNLFYPFIIILDNIDNLQPLHTFEMEELSGVQIEGIAISGKGTYLFSNEKSAIPQSLHMLRLKM
ncbi:MAG: hypothetical protein JXB00_18840 [Bacteroidales bacterium]|nr:hypothetical protein [Bacteroidales bacterium]